MVESWDVMIDLMRKAAVGHENEKEAEDLEFEEKNEWESVPLPKNKDGESSNIVGGIGMGLSRRIGQVRTGDWGLAGMTSGKKRPSSLRNQELY